MSVLSQCNYCLLADIRADAVREGKHVVVVDSPFHEESSYKSVDVLVYPPGETPNRDKHFAAWLMELSDVCACR